MLPISLFVFQSGITITFPWTIFKWMGLPLFILSIFALLGGSLPDSAGSSGADGLRWWVWPIFLIWLAVILFRGLWL